MRLLCDGIVFQNGAQRGIQRYFRELLGRIADGEHNGDVRVEGLQALGLKIGRGIEREPVGARLQPLMGRHHVGAATGGIGSAAPQQRPTSRLPLHFQAHGDALSRPAFHKIKHVQRDGSHQHAKEGDRGALLMETMTGRPLMSEEF